MRKLGLPNLGLPTFVATLAAILAPVLGHAGALVDAMADVEVYDRTVGRTLPIYEHQGRLYVAGEPRHQYELRVRNSSGGRMLAVTSVDGVNVITGETAAQEQSGYVLGAWDSVRIEGWRKNLDEVATFYFTRLSDSYAARTGRPNDVGVIGVALFREYRDYQPYRPCCRDFLDDRAAQAAPAAEPRAKSEASADESERRSESKLGTGHGHREDSPAQYVDFHRASGTPDQTIVIYYDSRRNLLAQGVIPPKERLAQRRPQPFPNGFAPDP